MKAYTDLKQSKKLAMIMSKDISAIGIVRQILHVCECTKNKLIAWLEKKSTPQVRTGLEWVNTIDDACDKRYSEEYAHGEYCHEQSFKWGFQEGVDWLEKQGKNNMGISEATKQKLEDNLNKALEKETPASWNEFLDEQGEQKPTNNVIEEEKPLLEKFEQAPAWSEEDIHKLNTLSAMVANNTILPKDETINLMNWLKQFRGRCAQQPKQEWSKDDITRIDEIIETLNIVQANRVRTQRMHYNKATIDKNIDWLKYLRTILLMKSLQSLRRNSI